MKKSASLILVFILIIGLTGCGSAELVQSSTTNSITSSDISSSEQSQSLVEQVTIQEFTCKQDDSFAYYVLYATNNSDKTINIEANMTANDSDGNLVGANSGGTGAIAPGQTAGIWTTFDEVDVITAFDYTLQVSEEHNYFSIYPYVTIDYNTTDNKIIASATNNGTKPAKYVWLDVVFIKDGEMVGFGELMFGNSDSELLPGVTLSEESECYSEAGFDSVLLALNGHVE